MLFGACVFFAFQIKLEEDISKFIPNEKSIQKFNYVFSNLKSTDKLVFTISLNDSVAADPDLLIEYTDKFADTLLKRFKPSHIKDLTYSVSEEKVFDVYSTFYNHLPLFLDDTDYSRIDSMLNKKSLEEVIKNDYKTMLSPASVVMKKFLISDPLGISFMGLNKLKSLQIDENYEIYSGHVFTKDRKHLLIFLSPTFSNNETGENTKLVEGIDDLISYTNTQYKDKVKNEYFGAIAVAVANASQIKKDSLYTSIAALIIIIIFITYFFKRKSVIFLIILPVLFGAAFSVALLFLIQGKISAIALGAGSIILGLAINYSLHVFNHFRHAGSAEEVIKDLASPLTIGGLTTVGAFFSLSFTDSAALKDFGLFSGLSLVGAALFSLIVLPHLLVKKKDENHKEAKLNFIDKLSEYHFEKNKILVGFIFLLAAVSFWPALQVGFDSNMGSINFMTPKLKESEKNLNRVTNNSFNSVYLVSTGENMEKALANNEKTLLELKKLNDTKQIEKFSNISVLLMSKQQQELKIARWNAFWTREKKDFLQTNLIEVGKKYKFKTEAFASFYEALNKTYSIATPKEFDKLKEFFLLDWITETPDMTMILSMIKLDEKHKKNVYADFEKDENVVIFDKSYLTTKFLNIIQNDFNIILLISSLLVLGFLILLYGRLELGFISFLPMFISWLIILALMYVFGMKFNIINIIISTFIFGLGDDFSIFVMDGLLQEYKFGIKNYLSSHKTSIFLSAVTVLIGIGVLIFAKHPALRSIAIITIIGMTSVVIISYTVAPFLFKWITQVNGRKRAIPLTFPILIKTYTAFLYFVLASIITTILSFFIIYILPISLKKRKYFLHVILKHLSRIAVVNMFGVKSKVLNESNEDFSKPAVIVVNHQSHIDLVLTMMLTPKMVILTNDTVWNSPFYGKVIRFADYYPVSMGYDAGLPKFRELIKDGYSILVFPEGTRSTDGVIKRFHKGAFYLAQQLNVEIIPILLHGPSDVVTKNELVLKKGYITVKILPRILLASNNSEEAFIDLSKKTCKMMRVEYQKIKDEAETVKYFRDRIIRSYYYKGPVVEWYVKVKMRVEDANYKMFNELLPKVGKIVDVGCGYGYLSFLLNLLSNKREIIGIDFDEEKIGIAQNNVLKNNHIEFYCDDVTAFEYPQSDAFLIADVLHYLPFEKQQQLLASCLLKLNNNGVMIVRDANSTNKKQHKKTRIAEFISTRLGFNKTYNDSKNLWFINEENLRSFLKPLNASVEKTEDARFMSNVVYVIRKKKIVI